MTTYILRAAPAQRHQARKQGDVVHVDGHALPLRRVDEHGFVVHLGGRAQRLHAVAQGDTVHVQLNGRACTIERLDPTRSAAAGAADAGGAHAPMPGVVVSWLLQPGSEVKAGDGLLVIESMKLQMTIAAARDGVLADLPFSEGQTFHRGALLARIRAADDEEVQR